MNKYVVDRWINKAELIKTESDDRRKFDERDKVTIEDLFDVVFSLQEKIKILNEDLNFAKDSALGMVDPYDE